MKAIEVPHLKSDRERLYTIVLRHPKPNYSALIMVIYMFGMMVCVGGVVFGERETNVLLSPLFWGCIIASGVGTALILQFRTSDAKIEALGKANYAILKDAFQKYNARIGTALSDENTTKIEVVRKEFRELLDSVLSQYEQYSTMVYYASDYIFCMDTLFDISNDLLPEKFHTDFPKKLKNIPPFYVPPIKTTPIPPWEYVN